LWIHANDPGADPGLLVRAERDLQAAVAAAPTLAGAWATLAFLLYARGDIAASEQMARKALEQDAWLEDADQVLERLFQAALMRADYRAAEEACDRGRASFPRDWRFVECRLSLLREDGTRRPDPVLAWRLVDELDALDPPARAVAAGRAYSPIYRRMLAAAVSARAGDTERARATLDRARVDAAADPQARVSLAYDEAVVLLLLGDRDQARERLEVYLAQNPGLRPFVARDPLLRELFTAPVSKSR
ncbi:MAG TPA: hypothetical protein VEQ60_15885, partial [Longimicrobium sp.]|nr:hypothetical protein [Longimicrobium sp.]